MYTYTYSVDVYLCRTFENNSVRRSEGTVCPCFRKYSVQRCTSGSTFEYFRRCDVVLPEVLPYRQRTSNECTEIFPEVEVPPEVSISVHVYSTVSFMTSLIILTRKYFRKYFRTRVVHVRVTLHVQDTTITKVFISPWDRASRSRALGPISIIVRDSLRLNMATCARELTSEH